MAVRFREVDQFDLWVWAQVPSSLSNEQRETLSEVLKAWFILGRLGGYNAANSQVQAHADAGSGSVSGMPYAPLSEDDGAGPAFNAMAEPEFRDNWLRCWFDLGAADEVALDVLVNAFAGVSREHIPVAQLIIGGINDDWAEGTKEPKKALEAREKPVFEGGI